MVRCFRRVLLLLSVAGALAAAGATVAPAPALADYGKANWQVALSGTATFPGSASGFGFWGWCAFGGGVTSGDEGDCVFSQYVHAPKASGFTCEISLDVTSWDGSGGTFVISGTATAQPAAVADACLAFFPGSATFTDVDTEIPSAAGHYNLGNALGGVGSFQIQVAQVP